MESNEREAVVEEQFPVGASPQLELTTVSGRVTIRPSHEPTIQLHARKYGRAQAVEATRLEFSHEGDMVRIDTKGGWGLGLSGKSLCPVDFDLWVPRGCRVWVEAVDADVDISAIGGPVEVRTVSGTISLDDVSDSSAITTVSGACTGNALDGTLYLKTVSGNARVTRSRLSSFGVQSVSGSVALEAELLPNGDYRAKTVSGDVTMRIPANQSLTVRLESVSGRVQSDVPATLGKVGFGSWQGDVNGGGAELRVNTVSGSVTIAAMDVPVHA